MWCAQKVIQMTRHFFSYPFFYRLSVMCLQRATQMTRHFFSGPFFGERVSWEANGWRSWKSRMRARVCVRNKGVEWYIAMWGVQKWPKWLIAFSRVQCSISCVWTKRSPSDQSLVRWSNFLSRACGTHKGDPSDQSLFLWANFLSCVCGVYKTWPKWLIIFSDPIFYAVYVVYTKRDPSRAFGVYKRDPSDRSFFSGPMFYSVYVMCAKSVPSDRSLFLGSNFRSRVWCANSDPSDRSCCLWFNFVSVYVVCTERGPGDRSIFSGPMLCFVCVVCTGEGPRWPVILSLVQFPISWIRDQVTWYVFFGQFSIRVVWTESEPCSSGVTSVRLLVLWLAWSRDQQQFL